MGKIRKDRNSALLEELMDFGRFMGHSSLAAMAAGAEQRYPPGNLSSVRALPGDEAKGTLPCLDRLSSNELTDDELEDLFAAGDSALNTRREDDIHG